MVRIISLFAALFLCSQGFAEIIRCSDGKSFLELRNVSGMGYVVTRAYEKDARGGNLVLVSNYVVGDFEKSERGYTTTSDNETFLRGVEKGALISVNVSAGGILHHLVLSSDGRTLLRFDPPKTCSWVDVEPKGLLSTYGASFKSIVSERN